MNNSLGGAVAVSGATSVASGGTLAPGDATVGNLTFGAGLALAGSYAWELAALSTASPGANFDALTVTAGNVDLTGATLALNLGANAPADSAFWRGDQTWTGILNNTGLGSIDGSFGAIDNSAWSAFGAFSTAIVGNDVNLVWTAAAVPEPGACAALAGAAVLGLVAHRRRRVR